MENQPMIFNSTSLDQYSIKPRKKSISLLKCTFENCQKTFNSQSSLSRHRNVHLGIQPYACPYPNCSSKFSQRTSLRHHIRTHTGERPYVCQHCGWAFATNGNRIDHERRHLKIKPYSCDLCGKCFYRPHQLKSHQFKCADSENNGDVIDDEETYDQQIIEFDFRPYNKYLNVRPQVQNSALIFDQNQYKNIISKPEGTKEQGKIAISYIQPLTNIDNDTYLASKQLEQLKNSFLSQTINQYHLQ
eukprot:403343174